MGEIVDLSKLDIKNSDLDFELNTLIHQDITDDLKYCKELRKRPGNGFWNKRQGRQIGSIPNVAYLKALQDGYDLESDDREIKSKEFKRYLNDYPMYRTVEQLVTPTSGEGLQLIIK